MPVIRLRSILTSGAARRGARTVVTSLALLACGEGVSNASGTPTSEVDRIELSSGAEEIMVGATTTFVATATNRRGEMVAGLPVAWGSTDPAVASVSGTGVG